MTNSVAPAPAAAESISASSTFPKTDHIALKPLFGMTECRPFTFPFKFEAPASMAITVRHGSKAAGGDIGLPPKAAIRAGGHSRSAEHPLSAHDHTTTGD